MSGRRSRRTTRAGTSGSGNRSASQPRRALGSGGGALAPGGDSGTAKATRALACALAGDHRGALPHPRMVCQRRLDLAGLDPLAGDLHLRIRPPEEVEAAVGQPAHPVAGAVEAAAGPLGERIGAEALGGPVRAVEVAARQAVAADPELPRHAGGHPLQAGVEHVGAGVGDRPSDRHRAAGRLEA